MARGFVRKRGANWYAYWRDTSGRQRSKAISPRKKEAEHYLDTVQGELASGTYREIKEATFLEFGEMWLRDYAAVAVKPSTLATYTSRIRGQYADAFGARSLSAITKQDIQHYLAGLQARGLTASTLRHHLILLREILRAAVEWDYLTRNPAEGIKSPRVIHKEMRFLTPEDIPVFLQAVDPDYRALFTTAVMTGLRLGELLALQWDDIDWRGGTIRVRRSLYRGTLQTPKSVRSTRTVGMSRRLGATLLEHKTAAPYSAWDLVFCTADGTPLDPANLRQRVFESAVRRAGFAYMRIHDLRHTFASLLINQGENLKYVQAQLGHASIQTTVDRYGHLMPDAHVGASERLDATLFGQVPENLDDKMLTSPRATKQAPSSMSPGPAVSLVAGAGFEPTTFGL